MIGRLFSTESYTSAFERDRARLIYVTTITLLILFTFYAAFVNEPRTGSTGFESLATDPTAQFSIISLYVLGIGTLMATRRGWRLVSGIGPAVLWFFSAVQIAIREGFTGPTHGITLISLILLSGVLMQVRGIIVSYFVALLTLFIVYGSKIIAADPGYTTSELFTLVLQTSGVTILYYLFLRNTSLTFTETLATVSEDRLKLAALSTQIAQRISRRLDMQDVLDVTVEQIRESYPQIYHAQIFLIDDSRAAARLAASTGEVGRALLERRHSLVVGSQSVIGQVTATGQPMVAYAGHSDSIHQRNELLPETVVEAAFPLRMGDDIIGALDLQSKDASAIPEADLPIFQSLADNIAIAIDNVRLTEQTVQRLVENQQLLEQMRTAMQQVERLNQQLTTQAWTDYLARQRGEATFTLDLQEQKTEHGSEWTPALVEAVQQNELVRKQERDQTTIAVPLRVRGQVIGAMEFELENGVLSAEDVDLVETVGERLGLALESARLYDESRRVAHREAMLNQIGGRLQSSNNVEGVLSEAARGLQSTLGAQRVAIRLGTPTLTDTGTAQQRNRS
jgi:GAF domain-containing protein